MLLHKSNKIIKDDVTLLIQGKYSNVFINKIDNYIPHFKKIIYSTWNDNNIDFNNNVEYIINKLPNNDVYNLSNIYYQCKSILNGIQRIKTKYVLKHRSDEYYSNIELLYTYFNGNLLCSNVYFRPIKYKPYHISDHFFWVKLKG